MKIFSGDMTYDLSAAAVYLQLMLSLESSAASILNPEVRQTLVEIASLLKRGNKKEIELKGKTLCKLLWPIIHEYLQKAPPKIQWHDIAYDYTILCKDDTDLYSNGICYEWLYERMDCSQFEFFKFPLHSRVGIGHHAGRASVEEYFLLEDAFYLLSCAENSMVLLQFSTKELNQKNIDMDHPIIDIITCLNQNVAINSRMCVVSFIAFIESFINGVGYDYFKRNSKILDAKEHDILSGRSKGRYIPLYEKLKIYPTIINPKTKNAGCIKLDYGTLISRFKDLRDSSMHFSPDKTRIWIKPEQWIQEAQASSKVSIDLAIRFWQLCYPDETLPVYLCSLDYNVLLEKGNRRLKESYDIYSKYTTRSKAK